MTLAIIILAVTLSSLTASILFFPSVQIGKVRLDTYWVIAATGAFLIIVTGLVPLSEIWTQLTAQSEINPLKILALFFSMTVLSVFLDEAGFFRYLARKAVHLAKSSQLLLFVILYVLTAILTVFTSNDIVILTLTPFICFFCKNTGRNPLPFLVSEFAAANTWSMMLIIGNPTNIYLATSAGISFADYFKVMALPTVCAGLVQAVLIIFVFSKQLSEPLTPHEDDFKIECKTDLWLGLIHLGVCLVFLVISGYIHVQMWLISTICALSLFIFTLTAHAFMRRDVKCLSLSLKRLPWPLIPFVLSMFVLVICMNYCGIAKALGSFIGTKHIVMRYGILSFITANLINNIPMSMLFSSLPVGLPQGSYLQAIYATVVGSNIGAFLAPIGALAGIMFTNLTSKYDVKYGFLYFIKYGTIISIPTIAAALFVLSLLTGQ